MRKYVLLSALVFTGLINTYATHFRAGTIYAQRVNDSTVSASLVIYSEYSPNGLSDRDSMEVFWGDGTFTWEKRSNGPDVEQQNGIPDGEIICSSASGYIKKSVYVAIHVYSNGLSSGYVTISARDINRRAGIVNIVNAVNVPFYVESTILLDSVNITPVAVNEYYPCTCVLLNDTFYYNPGITATDADSLVFEEVVPLQAQGTVVPGYAYPQDVVAVPNDDYWVDSATGEMWWVTPKAMGVYVVAYTVTEFRNGTLINRYLVDIELFILSNCAVGLSEVQENFRLNIMPNPASDFTGVNLSTPAAIIITDLTGREVIPQQNYAAGQPVIDISALPAGVYTITARTSNGIGSARLIKQ